MGFDLVPTQANCAHAASVSSLQIRRDLATVICQEHGVLGRDGSTSVRRRSLARGMAYHCIRSHAPRSEEVDKRDLDGCETGLRELGFIQSAPFFGSQDLLCGKSQCDVSFMFQEGSQRICAYP